jgi:Sulfotransferase domain
MLQDSKALVYVVSGLPRSGTSLMMQMLKAGGLEVVSDGQRAADDDNPRGYLELEQVKRTKEDPSWLTAAEGKAVKVVSQLLQDLPADRRYKVLFMRRALDEVLISQKKMLARRGEPSGAADQEMKEIFIRHLEEIETFLARAAHIETMFVNYGRLLESPRPLIERVTKFLGLDLDIDAMAGAVDPNLFRSRPS